MNMRSQTLSLNTRVHSRSHGHRCVLSLYMPHVASVGARPTRRAYRSTRPRYRRTCWLGMPAERGTLLMLCANSERTPEGALGLGWP